MSILHFLVELCRPPIFNETKFQTEVENALFGIPIGIKKGAQWAWPQNVNLEE